MKKRISTILITVLVATAFMPGTSVYGAVIDSDIPNDITGSKWEVKLGTGYAAAPTPPLLHGGCIYVGAANKLYKLNKDTGAILKTSGNLAGNMGYAMMPPVYGNGMIYISVGNGTVQALDANSLALKWTSSPRTGATNSPLIYDGESNKIFTGTWNNKDEGGEYFCLDAKTGNLEWTVSHSDGFYWSGAFVEEDYIAFGSEQVYRTTDSTVYSVNKETGEIISTMSAIGNIRCTITGDSDYIYVPTQSGKLYKIKIDGDGRFENSSIVDYGAGTTGKPTLHDDRIYFGASDNTIKVYNLSDLSLKHSIQLPGYPQSEFLLRDKGEGSIEIFSAYNLPPGGICRIEISDDNVSVNRNFFVPADSQFCTSPLICDSEGTIYYKNDSGNVMAVSIPEKITGVTPTAASGSHSSIKISWKKMSGASGYDIYRSTSVGSGFKKITSCGSGTVSFTDKGLKTGTVYYYKLQARYTATDGSTRYSKLSQAVSAKPILGKTAIKTRKGKKQIKITWKKVPGASGYEIFRAAKKKGKYKKVKNIKKGSTKTWTNKKLKSKKKYYYKVRAYKKVDGKKVYSVYSNISYKKTK